jgi:pimeloyl-ACP methyl ester carboxylesterase
VTAYDDNGKIVNLPIAVGGSIFPGRDVDASRFKAQILRELQQDPLELGEQLNFIGYSGGASVAMNAAALLQGLGIQINNLVTIGGNNLRGKPGNVGRWISVVGTLDPWAISSGIPDAGMTIEGAYHTDYLTRFRTDIVDELIRLGLR